MRRLYWIVLTSSLIECTTPVGTTPNTGPGSLPDDSEQLIKLSDQQSQKRTVSITESSQMRAALERALPRTRDRFEIHWRIARSCFQQAEALSKPKSVTAAGKAGSEQAKLAATARPGRVEGHYYLALNIAKIAEANSKLLLIKSMVSAAQKAAEIDASYDRAGPLVFLGKVYLTAPSWPVSVGDPEKAIGLLQRALKVSDRPLTHIFLAQAFFAEEQFDEASAHIDRALTHQDVDQLESKWIREAKQLRGKINREMR